jgi:hypothetical protein
MRYSLFPFPSLIDAGGPDICGQLRWRERPRRGIANLELLEATVDLLRDIPWQIQVDHCIEQDGDLHLAVVATDLACDVSPGDEIRAGFCLRNSDTGACQPFACERVFRVKCSNGMLVEYDRGQATTLVAHGDWHGNLSEVVERSFAADGLDRDVARFRATVQQMLLAPYELLCNLVAQDVISEEEQCAIQAEFHEAGDETLYGLINAVTRVAGELRDTDEWKRSLELERLGGEIMRGDHQPPVLDPVYA